MKVPFIIFVLTVYSIEHASSQNAYYKLGQQALMDGDFKSAVAQLEKACLIDSTNGNALWMLGYSYYHSANYRKSIAAYTKEIFINPTDATAYYYRGRAKGYMGEDNQSAAPDKERFLLGAIFDLTKAISIDPNGTDNKYYQTRGIAYREYGLFKLQAQGHFYDRSLAVNALKASVKDFEKVLAENPARSDISALIDISKQKLNEALKRR